MSCAQDGRTTLPFMATGKIRFILIDKSADSALYEPHVPLLPHSIVPSPPGLNTFFSYLFIFFYYFPAGQRIFYAGNQIQTVSTPSSDHT